MSSILRITDGTIEIDLLAPESGVHVVKWNPQTPTYKNDGTFMDGTLTDGRRLVDRKFTNITESFDIIAVNADQDGVIRDLQNLRRLLEDAANYWTQEWNTTPVYIVARGPCETNSRYAVIVQGRIQEDADPYTSPFFSVDTKATAKELTLSIEHGFWLDTEPGYNTCVPIHSGSTGGNPTRTGRFYPFDDTDDGYAIGGSSSTIVFDNTIYIGNSTGNPLNGFIRFTNVNIPAGSLIVSAELHLYSVDELTAESCNVIISGDRNANCATFSTYVDWEGRTRTSHNYTVAIPPLNADELYSQDVTDIISEIVNLPGWAENNSLAILIDNNATGSPVYRQMYDLETGNGFIPELFIEFIPLSSGITCLDTAYISNHNCRAQISHIYYYDDSITTFSSNLVGEATPFNLLPDPPGVDDIIYFGIDTDGSDYGPFASLVFDIGTNVVTQFNWEYYDGAAWAALTIKDNTDDIGTRHSFHATGIHSIHWPQPNDWEPVAINGITAWWVRAVVDAGPAADVPTQQNRDIFTINNSYVDVTGDNLGGDLPVSIQIKPTFVSRVTGGPYILGANRFLLSSRSISRGSNFTAVFPGSDTQVPIGFAVSNHAANSTFEDESFATLTGRVFKYSPVAAEILTSKLWWYITTYSVSNEYVGKYRAFVGFYTTEPSNQFFGALSIEMPNPASGSYTVINQTDTAYFRKANGLYTPVYVAELGTITIPEPDTEDDVFSFKMNLHLGASDAGDLYVYFVLLMPVDEWSADIYDSSGNFPFSSNYYLLVNGPGFSKRSTGSKLYESNDRLVNKWLNIGREPTLFCNKDQRLWAIAMHSVSKTYSNIWVCPPEPAYKLEINKMQRYMSMRGER